MVNVGRAVVCGLRRVAAVRLRCFRLCTSCYGVTNRSYAATAFTRFAPKSVRLACRAVAREAGEGWWS